MGEEVGLSRHGESGTDVRQSEGVSTLSLYCRNAFAPSSV